MRLETNVRQLTNALGKTLRYDRRSSNMPGQKNRRPTYGLRWGLVSMLLILALVLPAAQPSAVRPSLPRR